MAHSIHTKAYAMALLLTGDSPRFVARQTGVPLTTVKRWRKREALPLLREIFWGRAQNGPKKSTVIS